MSWFKKITILFLISISYLYLLDLKQIYATSPDVITGATAPWKDCDYDRDGYVKDDRHCNRSVGIDCDDYDSSVNPGAQEVCDNKDNNCNGQIDEGCNGPVDNDGDGYTVDQGDCDDHNPNVHPGAVDVCGNGIDEDCNGADRSCQNPTDKDQDKDGYIGAAYGGDDCNDTDSTIHPGAQEICGDNIDQNCNGVIDDGCSTDNNGGDDQQSRVFSNVMWQQEDYTSNPSGGCACSVNASTDSWSYLLLILGLLFFVRIYRP